MPYLSKGDFETHVYAEIIDTITREQESIVNECIAVAIDEAKSYLMRFDLVKLFGDYSDPDNAIEPTVKDSALKSKIKDIACWHLIKLANPNINLELFRTGYEDAIKYLDNIKKSQLAPEGWVYKTDDAGTEFNEGGMVYGKSNTKKRNHW